MNTVNWLEDSLILTESPCSRTGKEVWRGDGGPVILTTSCTGLDEASDGGMRINSILKGTVQLNFQPPVFFIIRTSPWTMHWPMGYNISDFGKEFASYSMFSKSPLVSHTPVSQSPRCMPPQGVFHDPGPGSQQPFLKTFAQAFKGTVSREKFSNRDCGGLG